MQTLYEAVFTVWNIVTLLLCALFPIVILWKFAHTRELVSYIPAFCTSIGLLMTFLVLWKTLGVDLQNLNLTGQDSVKETILQLSNKFSCSLIGIAASIGWSIWLKSRSGKEALEKTKHPWAEKDPQELLWELVQGQNSTLHVAREAEATRQEHHSQVLEAIQGHEHEMTARLDTLGEHVQNHLGETFTNLQTLLKDHLEHLGAEALDRSRQNVEDIHQHFTDNTRQLLEAYQSGLTENLNAVLASVGNLQPSLDALLEKISQRMQATQEQTDKQTQTLREGFETGTKAMLDKFGEQADRLDQTFQRINDTFSTLDEKVIGSTQAILDDNLIQLKRAFDSIEEMQSRSKTFLEETTKQFSQSVMMHRETCDSQQQILEKVEAQLALLEGLHTNATDHFEGWKTQLEEVKNLRNRVSEIANTIDELQQLNERLAKLPAHFSN